METPTRYCCPHCTYALRLVVPASERCRIVACPGCRTPIRMWAAGDGPRPASTAGSVIVVALVIAAIFLAYSVLGGAA